eukprot:COSAG03_NODE_712_length_6155_cov_2.285832_5_plen_136_part_00
MVSDCVCQSLVWQPAASMEAFCCSALPRALSLARSRSRALALSLALSLSLARSQALSWHLCLLRACSNLSQRIAENRAHSMQGETERESESSRDLTGLGEEEIDLDSLIRLATGEYSAVRCSRVQCSAVHTFADR